MKLKEAVAQLVAVKSDLISTTPVQQEAVSRNRIDQVITLLNEYPVGLANLVGSLGGLEGAAPGMLVDSYNDAPEGESKAELAIRIACKSLAERTTALAVERTNNTRLERQLNDLRAEYQTLKSRMSLTSALVAELLKVTS